MSQPQNLLVADVTNEAEVARVLTNLVNVLGRLDVLINLVGGFTPEQILTLNVTSAFLLSRAAIPKMSP